MAEVKQERYMEILPRSVGWENYLQWMTPLSLCLQLPVGKKSKKEEEEHNHYY